MPPRKKLPPLGPAHERLGKRIRELRERAGRTQESLWVDGLIGKGHYSELESGRTAASAKIIEYLTQELPTWGAELHSLHTYVILERNQQREEREELRNKLAGATTEFIPREPTDYQTPDVEVLDGDGETLPVPIVDVAPDAIDVSGPFVIEEIDEHVIVSSSRTFEVTTLRRKLRATADGLHTFRYMMEEDSTSPLSRISFRVVEPATVTRVLRISRTHYVFEMTWPEPLCEGEDIEFRFSIYTVNATSEPKGLFLKQQMVATEHIDLAVEFKDVEPARVYRIDVPAPSMIMAFPEFPFNEEMRMEPNENGVYARRFEKTMMPGRMVGIAWDFEN